MKPLLILFCIFCTTCLKSQSLKQAEYFIDKDKGVGKNTKINLIASADSSYLINIDVAGISEGLHKLCIRTKDGTGRWSFPVQRTIEVTESFNTPEIIAGEYFFDQDPGYKKANVIAVPASDTDAVASFTAAVTGLNTGYHKLCLRFRDDKGNWSMTTRRNIEIIKTADTIKIVEAEYFFAADDGYGKEAVRVFTNPLEEGDFKFKIPFNSIPPNANTLFIRVKDSLNNWSLTTFDTFTIQSFAKTLIASDAIINSKTGFSIFPNPASESIQVHYQQRSKNPTIQIFDMNGKTVLQTIAQHENNVINISRFSRGTYLLQLKDGDTIQTAKFIKQ